MAESFSHLHLLLLSLGITFIFVARTIVANCMNSATISNETVLSYDYFSIPLSGSYKDGMFCVTVSLESRFRVFLRQ
jgi:hypothetical protein